MLILRVIVISKPGACLGIMEEIESVHVPYLDYRQSMGAKNIERMFKFSLLYSS